MGGGELILIAKSSSSFYYACLSCPCEQRGTCWPALLSLIFPEHLLYVEWALGLGSSKTPLKAPRHPLNRISHIIRRSHQNEIAGLPAQMLLRISRP